MIKTTASFFDGKTSMPLEIGLTLDDRYHFLTIETNQGETITWDVRAVTFEKMGDSLNISFGKDPVLMVKTSDEAFISAFIAYMKLHGHIGWYQRFIDLGFKVHLVIALLILAFIITGYFFILPGIAERAAVLIPESYDNYMGSMFIDEFKKHNDIDSTKTQLLNDYAERLDLQNRKPLKFTVVESSTVNAFALPDGNIIVFTGLIDIMKSQEELAALISHEVVHVNSRHSMKMMCRNLAGYLFISVVLTDVNGIMAVIGDNVHSLQSLSYSRHFEREADTKGVDLMVLNQIDPKGMVTLFEGLQSKAELLLPEFLSSHPITKERINYIEKLISDQSFQPKENDQLVALFQQLKTPCNR
jgi:predicted Zn-dependent protease